MIKKLYSIVIATLVVSLSGCYLPQNFDNQVQISRTGQYQVDVDTDVIGGNLVYAQNISKTKNEPITANGMQKISTDCENEFNQVVALDAKKDKHIVSSKYLGECKGHLTLSYKGNIIQEKEFNAGIGSQEAGFFIPLGMKYDAKKKQIIITSGTHGDKSAFEMYGNHQYNGKMSVKTDAKVISTNAASKPYWGLIGAYKWNIKDFTDPSASMVLSTTGI